MGRQRWGQNFLVNPGVVRQIVERAAPAPEDLVVEVGPGRGVLTRPLMEFGCRVLALEIDPELASALEEELGHEERFEIRRLDALDADWQELAAASGSRNVLFVANLPYESGSAILLRWLEATTTCSGLSKAVLMLQLEVAERIAAAPRTKAYGSLGALAQATHEVQRVVDVAPGSFRPPPKVRSRVIELSRRGTPLLDLKTWRTGADFLHAAFGKRRKQLATGLAGHGGLAREDWQALLTSAGHAVTARAEELTPEELLAIARAAGLI